MAFTRNTVATNNVSSLPNKPTISATALKAVFDKFGVDEKAFFNSFLTELESSVSAASLGAKNTETNVATNVQAELLRLWLAIQGVSQGAIPDGSITSAKLDQALIEQLSVASYVQDNTGTSTAMLFQAFAGVDGEIITFKAEANVSGTAVTANGRPVYKAGTTNNPTFVQNKYYTLVFDLAQNRFFLKASAEGDAIAAHVLAGKYFSNDTDTYILGTMPRKIGQVAPFATAVWENGDLACYLEGGTYNWIDAAELRVTVSQLQSAETDLSSANILSGKSIFGVTGNHIATAFVGDVLSFSHDDEAASSSTSYVIAKSIKIAIGGTYRVKFDLRNGLNTAWAYGKIYINGSPVGVERSNNNNNIYATFSEDFTVNAGDFIQLYIKCDSFVQVRNFRLYNSQDMCADIAL